VRVAIIERFAEPSRRCDPELVTTPDDEVILWDLTAVSSATGWQRVLELVGAVPAWLRTGAGPGRVVRYLRACLATSGWRHTSLVGAPAWIRRAREHDLDAVLCFSADGFELARLLAEEAGVECREQLARGTQYFGEFAFEMLAVVPYAHWLHEQGRLEFTVSTPDTSALYYFSPRHLECTRSRRYVPITEYPVGESGRLHYDVLGFPAALPLDRWSPPPYRAVFADDRFTWRKPLVVIANKTSEERYLTPGSGTNSIPVGTLLELVGRLTAKYTVVYNRPREVDIVGDHDVLQEPGDIEAVEDAFPEVVTIQQLHAEHADLMFNELQLRLYASCERFVSVLGGGSYLASYFGGVNIVYAQAGWEIDCGAYERWFDRFSGADVVAAGSPAELLRLVEERFLRD
jgi:hypothetical protein